MAAFDAKADTPASVIDAADKIPFGDVSADGWDTILMSNFLTQIFTTPIFTTGSVAFTGATGALAQDNANLFWASNS